MTYNLKEDTVKSEKYRREGPRYVCKNCKAKYFAKFEVEQCFDSHAPAPVEAADKDKEEGKKKPA